MKIQLNGQSIDYADNTSVTDILAEKKIEPNTVIVELNRTLLTVDQLDQICLKDGDTLEIIRFVGGG